MVAGKLLLLGGLALLVYTGYQAMICERRIYWADADGQAEGTTTPAATAAAGAVTAAAAGSPTLPLPALSCVLPPV